MVKKSGANILPFFIVLVLLIAGFVFLSKRTPPVEKKSATYPEIQTVEKTRFKDFSQLSQYFTKLAESKGAPYAYEVLKRSKTPPNTDLHLLGHTIGDILYKQKGVDGILTCTQDFRNACSHSVVVGILQDKGEAAFPQIVEACHKAPGKSGAYTMCFHGLGHGVLAYYDYDFEKTVQSCGRIGKKEDIAEKSQCISGAVMEIISGGAHNHEIWAEQRKKYLSTDAPLQICLNDYVPKYAQGLCFLYLTPYLFVSAGADLANPTEADFQKAFRFCDQLPLSDDGNRYPCYGGFGKEFTALANRRDIQRIDKMSPDQLKIVYKWCQYAGGEKETGYCNDQAMQSLLWGGENDFHGAMNYCGVITNPRLQGSCYASLVNSAKFYTGAGSPYVRDLCSALPPQYQVQCQK